LELYTYHQESNANSLFRSLLKFRNLEYLAIYPGENARRQHFEKLLTHRRLKDVKFYFGNIDDMQLYYNDLQRRNRGCLHAEFSSGNFITLNSE
ncbi:16718_t:CDS:2, partial [Acaulospora morrowiae]